MTDNADRVSIPGIGPPDLGRESSAGFQSATRAHQRPYTRANRRITTMDGGGFQTAVRNEQAPFTDNVPTDEASD
jgi:hypothetical protein